MMILVKMRKTLNRTNFDRNGEDGLGLIVLVSQSVSYRRKNICAWEKEDGGEREDGGKMLVTENFTFMNFRNVCLLE